LEVSSETYVDVKSRRSAECLWVGNLSDGSQGVPLTMEISSEVLGIVEVGESVTRRDIEAGTLNSEYAMIVQVCRDFSVEIFTF
jgi:hypothetical protein